MGLLLCTTAASYAAGKTALVLAVQDYQNLPKSSIGVKRAADIADALTALGYDVIQNANPTNAAARASLRDFAHKAETADVALAFLIGHGVAWGGQTFFLPANVEIGRATDLLSRGISVSNVAQIVSKAAAAGVFVLTTSPEFPSPIEGIDKRPQFTGAIDKNVVAVFPSSGRVPVSRIDAMGEQAADAPEGPWLRRRGEGWRERRDWHRRRSADGHEPEQAGRASAGHRERRARHQQPGHARQSRTA
jgi:hypothetical protein